MVLMGLYCIFKKYHEKEGTNDEGQGYSGSRYDLSLNHFGRIAIDAGLRPARCDNRSTNNFTKDSWSNCHSSFGNCGRTHPDEVRER